MNTQRRALVAALVTAFVAPIVAFAGVAPAQAASDKAFEIFYGPDCGAGGSASKSYYGEISREAWITDIFDQNRFGSSGYKQQIRQNAASIYVNNASVTVYSDNGTAQSFVSTTCYNFGPGLRNHNISFSMR